MLECWSVGVLEFWSVVMSSCLVVVFAFDLVCCVVHRPTATESTSLFLASVSVSVQFL